jgi:hypothetical protein
MTQKDALFIAGSFTILGALIGFAGNTILQYIQRKKAKNNLIREKCEELFLSLVIYEDYIRNFLDEGRRYFTIDNYGLNILAADYMKRPELRSKIRMLIEVYANDIKTFHDKMFNNEVDFYVAFGMAIRKKLDRNMTVLEYDAEVQPIYNETCKVLNQIKNHVKQRIKQLI